MIKAEEHALRAGVKELAEKIGVEPIPAEDAPAAEWLELLKKIYATVEVHWDAW